MPTGSPAVFGQSSDEEEEENVKKRERRALQTLNELRNEPKKSRPVVRQGDEHYHEAVVCDDEEGEMARLRNAPQYVKFEKELGRDEQSLLLKKRKIQLHDNEHSNEQTDVALDPRLVLTTQGDEDGEHIGVPKVEKREDSTAIEGHRWKRIRGTTSGLPVASSDGSKPRQNPALTRTKIDPKIIVDSSESDSSDSDSDAGELGPQFPSAKDDDINRFPLTHEALFGTAHSGYVSSISVDAAGARLVTGSNDGSIKFWDFNTMDSRMSAFKYTEPFDGAVVKGVNFSSSGGQLLCWGAISNARVLDREGRPLAQTATGDMYIVDAARSKGHSGPIRCAAWFSSGSGKGRQIATIANEGTIRIWDVDSARRMPMHDIPIMVQNNVFKLRNKKGSKALAETLACVSDAGQTLVAVGCNDQTVKLVDPRVFSLRPSQEFCNVMAVGSEFTSVVASPPSCPAPLLLVRSTDDALRVLDRRRLDKPVASFLGLPNTISETNSCFLDASGEYFATGTSASRRGDTRPARVTVFSRKSMSIALHKDIEKEAGSVVCMSWHPKLNQVIYGCGNGSVRAMYDAEESSGGVLKCIVKESRKKVHGLVAAGVGPVMTPGSAAIHLSKSGNKGSGSSTKQERQLASKARQPHLKRGPETSKLGTTSSLAKYVREAGIKQTWVDEDPREALLRLDEETKKNPVFTRAYLTTQPNVLLAEKTAEQEEEEALRNATKVRLAKKNDNA